MLNFLTQFALETAQVFGYIFASFMVLEGAISAIFFRSRKKRFGKDDAWDELLDVTKPSLARAIITSAAAVFMPALYLNDITWIGAGFFGVFLGAIAQDHVMYAFLRWRFKRYKAKKASDDEEEVES